MSKAVAYRDGAVELRRGAPHLTDPAATLFVIAGIAASDVMACLATGVRSASADHREAIGALRRSHPGAAPALEHLISEIGRAHV